MTFLHATNLWRISLTTWGATEGKDLTSAPTVPSFSRGSQIAFGTWGIAVTHKQLTPNFLWILFRSD